MNKKGFTLIELLTVIIIIAVIMTLVFPSALKLHQENEGKICDQYRRMMIEYAMISDKNDEDYIDLNSLDELDEVKNKCAGYVLIDHSAQTPSYRAFLSCNNGCVDDDFYEYRQSN